MRRPRVLASVRAGVGATSAASLQNAVYRKNVPVKVLGIPERGTHQIGIRAHTPSGSVPGTANRGILMKGTSLEKLKACWVMTSRPLYCSVAKSERPAGNWPAGLGFA